MNHESNSPCEPLFTLREHNSSVLTCSFYPVSPSDSINYEKCCSFFLSGDADGVVLVHDLEIRRAVLKFHPVSAAHRQNRGAPLDPYVNVGILSVGFIAIRRGCNCKDESVRHDNRGGETHESAGKDECLLSTQSRSLSRQNDADESCASKNTSHGLPLALQHSTANILYSADETSTTPYFADECTRRSSNINAPYTQFRLPRMRQIRKTRRATTKTERQNDELMLHSDNVLHFYTQCRNQYMYIWEYTRSNSAHSGQHGTCDDARCCQLLYAVRVPQMGFCPVVASTSGSANQVHFIIPHDTDGALSIWAIEGKRNTCCCAVCASCGTDYDDHDDDKFRPVDVVQRSGQDTCISTHTSSLCTFHSSDAALKLRLLGIFSASPSVVAGCIMRISLTCSLIDKTATILGRVGVAFESGHVSLCMYSIHRSNRTYKTETDFSSSVPSPSFAHEKGTTIQQTSLSLKRAVLSGDKNGVASSSKTTCEHMHWNVVVLCRAFPESALVCIWEKDTVLVTSVEGKVQCYTLAQSINHLAMREEDVCAQSVTDNSLMHIRWELSLHRGLGSVVTQHNLVVLGGWDNTLRLYDVRTRRVITILPFHKGSVNEVAILPSAVSAIAPFAYDVRKPAHCSVHSRTSSSNLLTHRSTTSTMPAHDSCTRTSYLSGNTIDTMRSASESGVYVFASASRDGTIAVWRLDFN